MIIVSCSLPSFPRETFQSSQRQANVPLVPPWLSSPFSPFSQSIHIIYRVSDIIHRPSLSGYSRTWQSCHQGQVHFTMYFPPITNQNWPDVICVTCVSRRKGWLSLHLSPHDSCARRRRRLRLVACLSLAVFLLVELVRNHELLCPWIRRSVLNIQRRVPEPDKTSHLGIVTVPPVSRTYYIPPALAYKGQGC